MMSNQDTKFWLQIYNKKDKNKKATKINWEEEEEEEYLHEEGKKSWKFLLQKSLSIYPGLKEVGW